MNSILRQFFKTLVLIVIVLCYIPIFTQLLRTNFGHSRFKWMPNFGLWPFLYSWAFISLASIVLYIFFRESRKFALLAFFVALIWEVYLVVVVDGNL